MRGILDSRLLTSFPRTPASFPLLPRHSREGGNLAARVRRAFIRTHPTPQSETEPGRDAVLNYFAVLGSITSSERCSVGDSALRLARGRAP